MRMNVSDSDSLDVVIVAAIQGRVASAQNREAARLLSRLDQSKPKKCAHALIRTTGTNNAHRIVSGLVGLNSVGVS
jgi:hypothetical protein